jgi:CBS domain-containing protein
MVAQTRSLGKELENELIRHLPYKKALLVEVGQSLAETLKAMREDRSGCALIMSSGKLEGIFTERDVLTRVIVKKAKLSDPIENFMTKDPEVLTMDQTISMAIQIMVDGGYRHIPLQDKTKTGTLKIAGVLSVKDLVKYIGSNFPAIAYNLPPDPRQVNRAREGA